MQRRCTYRVQLRAEFDFAAAAGQASYLAGLGVSHVYCSPYLQAAAGSTHGYDVADPTRISEDLGGEKGHRHFTETLRAEGLGQLLDIVPNHMSVVDPRNAWWWDLLADGRQSPYASFFDIDWETDEPGLRHRVLLPVLGDQVGRVLENGEIRLVRENGVLLVAYFDNRYPLSTETVAQLLADCGAEAFTHLPAAAAALPTGLDPATRRSRRAARLQLGALVAAALRDAGAATAVDTHLALVNRDIAALDSVLSEQHHRLARWRTAVEEVNYRRFFDINTLVALRMEDPEVFAESTALITQLVHDGVVDGLRIDHIDGLRRPVQYAARLREATSAGTWLLAEKILERHERLPAWALDGTSGYDFLAAVNGLFVDPAGHERLVALHEEVTGQGSDFAAFALDGKREILRTTLVSDVERMTGLLTNVLEPYPAHRDHTHSELREAIIELVAAIPVYRTYVDPREGRASPADAATIVAAAAAAHASAPDVDERLLEFITDLFVSGEAHDIATQVDEDTPLAQRDLVLRLQQLSAATTAKGVEDTACYRHFVLVSLNEVGDSPAHFGMSVAEFHERNATIQRDRPHTLLTTSTHDTKRGEDVRCRIDLLSEVPDEWAAAVRRWRAMNGEHRRDGMPDAAIEYLLYQTLVGAWPITVERAAAYVEKAAHEAKRHTSWLSPVEEYDSALQAFVTTVLGDPRFVADLEGFVATLLSWGRVNSLCTTALKLTSPGVPDIYQGTELWDLSLVDPDNRRPVDYTLRRSLLTGGVGRWPADAWRDDPDSGAAKLWLIAAVLALRERCPEAFDERGTYWPIRAEGRFPDDVVAFHRGTPAAVVTVAQRRSLRRRGQWGDTMVPLPDGRWGNLADGATGLEGTVALDTLLRDFPVAVLERTA